MLEQPKKSGGKLVSHILASHGGIKELTWGSGGGGGETGINH